MKRVLVLLAIGLIGGLLSGAFGVGGGIVMVPMLVAFAGYDQRRASPVSLLAILPATIAGSVTYLAHGEVDVIAALLIGAGAVVGAVIGGQLLKRLPLIVLRWAFLGLLVVIAIRMAFVTPVRGEPLELTIGVGIGYVVLGLFMGTASGLFGIGGGAIAVPALVAIFGVSDLIAKGTSLLAMIPTTISGTITNHRNGLTDIRAGLIVGVAAAAASYPGALIAFALPPRLATILFALLLTGISIQMLVRLLRARRAA